MKRLLALLMAALVLLSLPVASARADGDDPAAEPPANRVARSLDRVESTKIGLRTCEKILEAMGGRFEVQKDEEHFAASLTLPTVKTEE